MGVVGLVLSLLTGIGVILFFGVVGLFGLRLAFLAGGLLGIGLTWLALTVGSAQACPVIANLCGNANLWPFAVIGAVLAGLGLLVGVIALVRARR